MKINSNKLLFLGLSICVVGAVYLSIKNKAKPLSKTPVQEKTAPLTTSALNPSASKESISHRAGEKINPQQSPVNPGPSFKMSSPMMTSDSVRAFLKTADPDDLPKDLHAALEESSRREKRALESEAEARKYMQELEACFANPAPDYSAQADKNLPLEIQEKLKGLGKQVQAECTKRANNVVKKYPNLRGDFDWAIRKRQNR